MHTVYNKYFQEKPKKVKFWLTNVLSSALEALIVLIIGLLIIGVRPYIVIGYSMEPEIPILSITLDIKQDEYKVGDVITFRSSAASTIRNTHRIVSIKRNADGSINQYVTHGDNPNISADTVENVSPALIDGKVIYSIPKVGDWFLVMKSNLFLTITTLLACYMVVTTFKQKESLTY